MERRGRILCCLLLLSVTIVLTVITYIVVLIEPTAPLNTASYRENKEHKKECANTHQGRVWITDDKGFVCRRKEVDVLTGCCKNGTRAVCDRSQSDGDCTSQYACCTSFETCVSCCLTVNDFSSTQQIEELLLGPSFKYAKPANIFDFCLLRCRTSSRSVVHQNAFRSEWKYCYGSEESPILLEDNNAVYSEVHDHREPK
eukprot:TRINITY_DN14276_c0_g1_i1.p1 TRINITY_DN14276_c0_g1~~TRINITY_DN14276_c0_g1_i1.p1  ORF type:complete len:200 (-),score=20.24 TRINITY_DN14276_c0_g1_i1:208-807(-)